MILAGDEMGPSEKTSTGVLGSPESFWQLAAGTRGTGFRTFVHYLFRAATFRRSSLVSMIVGTILLLINKYEVLLAGMWPPVWQTLAVYAVPFCVSSYTSASTLTAFDPDGVRASLRELA